MIAFQLRRLKKKKRKVSHPSPQIVIYTGKEPVLLAAKYCNAFHSVYSQVQGEWHTHGLSDE